MLHITLLAPTILMWPLNFLKLYAPLLLSVLINSYGRNGLSYVVSPCDVIFRNIKQTLNEDSWIKRDQLDVTCFIISLFNAQHVSDVNTSILRSLRLICSVISWVVLLWFDVCWCYVVVSVCRLTHCFSLHTDTTPPQPNHNVTPTHIEPEEYNPWNNSTNKSQAPEDGCINIRNMLSIK